MVWEERWHPLREEWVIVAAHRQHRPWIGETVARETKRVPPYDPDCAFCPGNARSESARNPAYANTFVFDNDHPCVGPDAPVDLEPDVGVFRRRPARGLSRVVCYSPRHDLTLAELPVAFVPLFARYAHEVYVAPKETHASLASLSDPERLEFAAALREVVVRLIEPARRRPAAWRQRRARIQSHRTSGRPIHESHPHGSRRRARRRRRQHGGGSRGARKAVLRSRRAHREVDERGRLVGAGGGD